MEGQTMGVFSRFLDIVNANINSLLDKAEDPEKMVKLMMQEMEDTLIELKSTCAEKIAKRTSKERERKEREALVERWQNRAELALSKHREDLAREALAEKRRHAAQLEQLADDVQRYEEIIAKSKEDISKLEDKLLSLKNKYQAIIERANRIREQKAASETIRKASDREAMNRFEQMEQQVDRMEANAGMFSQSDPVEKRFADLEEMEAIEAELVALRKQHTSSTK